MLIFSVPAAYAGIPKFSASFDFDPTSIDNAVFGFKVSAFSNERFWDAKNKVSTNKKTVPYTYGIGVGAYRTNGEYATQANEKYVYFSHLVLLFTFPNKSLFEPFVGIYPGYAWGAKESFFFNPVVGTEVYLFKFSRNFNVDLAKTYFQIRAEYNTALSTIFAGGGFVFQFF
ncbi:MAG: hypothetical protein LBS09_05815 [Bacteroidales bacterium]|nr:hypothetical protein [Bacteroidales bacterium]